MAHNRCSLAHDPNLINHNEKSSSDLEYKLKLSIDTIFEKNTDPLHKIGKLFDIAFKPLSQMNCNKPSLASGYLLLNQEEYVNSRIYDLNISKNLKRKDKIFTNIVPCIFYSDINKNVDPNNIIGYMTGEGVGFELPSNPELTIWKINGQITLDRSKLFNLKKDEYYLKNLVTARPYLGSTVYDNINKTNINRSINNYQIGSDGLYYYIREIPSPEYEPNSKLFKDEHIFDKYFIFKLEVYESSGDAANAAFNGYKINTQITKGNVDVIQLK
jgi:hypothetical protein